MKKEYRIKKNEEFSKILRQKHSLANSQFVIYWQKRIINNARFGISVSKKLGNAVVRNKIKRQVRMMILEILKPEEYYLDLIIIVRKDYLNNSYADNKKVLEKSLKTGKIFEYMHEVAHE